MVNNWVHNWLIPSVWLTKMAIMYGKQYGYTK